MAQHNETGKKGEALAYTYFIENGYEILHKNWRYKHWEVDLIAHKNELLHFIEVKCRSSKQFGFPEESVSKKKIQNLINASVEFIYLYPQYKRVQFDVLAINLHKNAETEYLLIPDVYDF